MALSEKERGRIVEEERLRYETRRGLEREYCSKHRSSRWKWWLAAAILVYALWCWLACGRAFCRYQGMGWHGQTGGHRCPYGDKMTEEADEKEGAAATPAEKPAAKPAKPAPSSAIKK